MLGERQVGGELIEVDTILTYKLKQNKLKVKTKLYQTKQKANQI